MTTPAAALLHHRSPRDPRASTLGKATCALAIGLPLVLERRIRTRCYDAAAGEVIESPCPLKPASHCGHTMS